MGAGFTLGFQSFELGFLVVDGGEGFALSGFVAGGGCGGVCGR